jgi:uncharacterized repeat protein (TIGR02543 family)
MYKKTLLSLMMTLLLAFIGVAKADVVEIGTGTSTTYQFPVNSLYNYSFTEMIYSAEEIGTAGTINSVAFHFNGANVLERTVVMYMKNVDRSAFASTTDYEDVTSADVVFTGTLASEAVDGWVTLELDTPFDYDGFSNLMIALDDNTGSWSSRYFYYTETTNAGLCYYSDTDNPEPSSLGGYSGSKVLSSNRPNVQLEFIPCEQPSNFVVDDIQANQVHFTWEGSSDNYNFEYKEASEQDWNSITLANISSYTMMGLEPQTDYNARIQSICTDGLSAWNILNFRTTPVPAEVGDAWSDNFEGTSCGWELINGELTNAWVWGTATNNGGTHALYVSNDGGTSNAYTTNSEAIVYVAKLLHFTEGIFEFSYDWIANGESYYDYLRVALVPASVMLTAGTSAPSGFGTSSLPNGWIALDDGGKLNMVTEWQSQSGFANVTTGNYYLVMAWRNDYSAGTNPPAAVDNVSIARMNSTNTYTITVDANPPYAGTATGGGEFYFGDTCIVTATANPGYSFVNWTKHDIMVGEYYRPQYTFTVSGNANIVANFQPMTYYSWVTSEPYGGGEVEIIAENTWELYYGDTITLQATPNNGYNFVKWYAAGREGRALVELSSDPTFTFVLNANLLDTLFSDFEYGGNAIEFIATFIEGIGDCIRPTQFTSTEVGPDFATLSWTELGTSQSWRLYYRPAYTPAYVPYDSLEIYQNPYTLTGLQPSTYYEAYIVPSCGITDGIANEYLASNTVIFTTLDACPAPFNLQVSNITHNSATVAWTGYNDEYTLSYRVPVFSENFEGGEIPQGWSNEGDASWTVGVGDFTPDTIGTHNGNYNAKITHSNSQDQTYFVTPSMNLGGQNDLVLSFWYINRSWGGDIDELGVYYRIGAQGAWQLLWSTTEAHETWTNQVVELTGLSDNYQIGFLFTDHYGYGVGLDDIVIAHEQISEWTTLSNATNPQVLTDLTPGTNYEVRVMGSCDETQTGWSNSAFFTTNDAVYYTITVTANPATGGNVTGGGTYMQGASCTLTATANTGYTFTNWTKNDGTVVSNNATYTFNVTESGAYAANFTLNSYMVTTSANPTEGGTVSGGGTYNHGQNITLTATANEGYTFTGWSDGVTTNPRQVTVTGPATYTANFQLNSYQVTVTANPTEGGSVSGGGTYNYGATINLTATANAGYTFTGWSDGVTDNPREITVTGPAEYVANFSTDSYLITVSAEPAAGGTVSGGGVYSYGATVNLTATANTGYTFTGWSDGVTDNPREVTVTGPAEYTAVFQLNSYQVTVTASPTEGGTVSGGGTYSYGTTVNLTVTANTGYTFTGWSDGVTDNPREITVTGPAEYIANFSTDSYLITVSAEPAAGGTVSGGGVYSYGATVNLTATANTGYTFTGWSDGETANPREITVTGPAEYTANFQLNSYLVTVTASPAVGGTVSGGGTYNYGATVNLTATAATGYTFIGWSDGETANPREITVTGSATYTANFQLNSYLITATASPTEGGSVSGGGTYSYGATVNLTATANTGYTFTGWSDGETANPREVTVTGPAEYTANFQLNSYLVTVTASPTEGGTVSGGGTYSYGATVNLTATAVTGYTFIGWSDGETANPREVTVTGPAEYTANFQLNSYLVTVTANPTAGGTVSGGGTYYHGETATLTATASVGYTFMGWSDGETANPREVTVTGPAEYTANFQLNSYLVTVTASPTAGGTVSGSGTYYHGETATLTATASVGYTFMGWSDGVMDNPRNVTVTGPAEYTANFQLNSYQITAIANPNAGGSVTGSGTYNHFQTCTLIATPNAYYVFTNWTKNGQVVSTDATYNFTVTEGGTYVAHFTRVSHQITALANPTEGGNVSGAGSYTHGSICTLTATASTGYHFTNWTKDGVVVSSNASHSFTVTEDATYVAHFNLNMYMVTVSADPTAGGMVSGGGSFLFGANCTVSAMPNAGYTFTNWTKNGTVVSTDAAYTFTVMDNTDLVAHFNLDHYNITVSVDPEAGGNATGGGSFTYGETCTLTATANTGYSFVNWTKNGTVVNSNATYSFTVTDNGDYVAHFAVARYTITVLSEPAEGGNVYGGGTYDFGHIVTLRAVAHEGYEFVNWTKDGSVISTNSIHPVRVTEDAEYVANFRINVFEIKAKTDPEYTGDIEGVGFYNYGETCTLTVTPHSEYEFINWTLDDQVVSESETFSFVVTEARDYTAHLRHLEGVVEQGGITVSLFPNPVKNKLTIEASEPIKKIEIYTSNGALVCRQNSSSDKIEIYVDKYAIGTYTIRLTTDSAVEIRKFVKE